MEFGAAQSATRLEQGSAESGAPGLSSLRSIGQAFADVAQRFPHKIALICGDHQLSYAALEARSNTVARGLIERGVMPGSTVGLSMPRSIDTIAAILGVLKAGAAYVPFDPAYPEPLLRYIQADSAPSVVLVQGAQQTPPHDGALVLDLATDFPVPAVDAAPVSFPSVGPGDCAYVMYTSGSTGRPKGVRIPHRAVLRLVIDNDFADFAADHVVLQLAPLAFDASTFEIWAALLHGARLAIVSAMHPSLDDIAQAITRHRVTSCWLTSGLFNLMVDHQLAAMTSLRQLLAGGDVLSVPHVRKAMKGLPDCRFINGYGPTENTTFSCCYTIPKDFSDSSVPIGKAIKHSEALILDDTLKPVADGEAGELFVGGDGLALGYLNRPELDAERFIPHPFDDRPEARLYRTGDRVRRRTDGNIEFHGRVDRQVKINGKRVELDEIEAVLHRSGLVADAAVTSFESGASQRKLAAYVTPAAGQALSIDVLREFLRRELPDYMVPGSLKILEKLPLSPTGKLDRARLPAPDADALTEQPKALPRNALEASLLAIWQRVLGRDGLGIDDNFFDAGGTSLQMMKVHAEILAARQQDPAGSGTRKISIIDLFTYPSISALAKWLSQPAAAPAPCAAMSAQERARRQSEALSRSRPQPRTPSR